METGLTHLHNLLRYAIIIFLVINVVKSFLGWFGKKEYTAGDNKFVLIHFGAPSVGYWVNTLLY